MKKDYPFVLVGTVSRQSQGIWFKYGLALIIANIVVNPQG